MTGAPTSAGMRVERQPSGAYAGCHHSLIRPVNASNASSCVQSSCVGELDRAGRLGRARLDTLGDGLVEDQPVVERVDDHEHPPPVLVADAGPGVVVVVLMELLVERLDVGDRDQRGAARAGVAVVLAEVQSGRAPGHLGVERGVVGVAAVLPVEGEAEVVDVELDGLGPVEDPQDRDGRAFWRYDGRVRRWAGREGVPVADAVLVRDELEGLAVAEGDVAGGQVGAQPAGHGLRIGHDAASLRRTPRLRQQGPALPGGSAR